MSYFNTIITFIFFSAQLMKVNKSKRMTGIVQ